MLLLYTRIVTTVYRSLSHFIPSSSVSWISLIHWRNNGPSSLLIGTFVYYLSSKSKSFVCGVVQNISLTVTFVFLKALLTLKNSFGKSMHCRNSIFYTNVDYMGNMKLRLVKVKFFDLWNCVVTVTGKKFHTSEQSYFLIPGAMMYLRALVHLGRDLMGSGASRRVIS